MADLDEKSKHVLNKLEDSFFGTGLVNDFGKCLDQSKVGTLDCIRLRICIWLVLSFVVQVMTGQTKNRV